MRREDANEIGLAVLTVVTALLAADCVWLHVKCARQADMLADLEARIERHVNPPGITDRMKESYQKAKTATVQGLESLKASAARQYKAVKEKFGQEK